MADTICGPRCSLRMTFICCDLLILTLDFDLERKLTGCLHLPLLLDINIHQMWDVSSRGFPLAARVHLLGILIYRNLSLECSVVPSQWQSSYDTLLPRLLSHLPASILPAYNYYPMLSRIMQKSLVKSLLRPILIHPDHIQSFSDQFGFRPLCVFTYFIR